ncbi:Prefoldin subunit 4 [Sistotremastrum niveocremeum HHB9708]|uniref:Prefoldin subunit 4 n=1 Tax=Sistotremastrum niveocremeum HHB9708 TaxID=1314777 RepID=A0A165A512_9AGAM|nr:Prefoldin subunit 4 [Sistotremastrum niveocremeum HHB9708]
MRLVNEGEEANDTEVTWVTVGSEDQQKINTFSKLNQRMRETNSTLETLKVEKESLDDLAIEIELADEDEPILYKVGDTFLHIPLPQAQQRLVRDQKEIDEEISKMSETIVDCEKSMEELKTALYARFGSAINLEEK